MTTVNGLKDLAPDIFRQRLVIEGLPNRAFSRQELEDYLSKLSVVCDMVLLTNPVMHLSEKYGWAGWIHWETSGTHLYFWEKPQLFFSVDIYTCKEFSVEKAVEFTKDFFDAKEIVYKEF
jgi:S-adenosylmethionine decarboxylase